MPEPIVTVIVCTYNRAELLKGVLQSLAGQTADKSSYEVIIVDNNPTDDTEKVSHSFVEQYPNFRYAKELNQGLSYARNRGWKEAIGKYVGYIDDDAIASQDWVEQIINFTLRHPEIKAFGGPYFGYSIAKMPDWIPSDFGTCNFGQEEHPITLGHEWVTGSNMIFEKTFLETIGGFRTDLGMAGNKVGYGEEIELQKRVLKAGLQIYYVPSIEIRHLIADYKFRFCWMLRSSYAHGRCSSRIFANKSSFFARIAAFGESIVLFFMHMLSPKNVPIKQRFYTSLKPIFYQAGALIEYFMILLKIETIE